MKYEFLPSGVRGPVSDQSCTLMIDRQPIAHQNGNAFSPRTRIALLKKGLQALPGAVAEMEKHMRNELKVLSKLQDTDKSNRKKA